jgi:hypothetical protein
VKSYNALLLELNPYTLWAKVIHMTNTDEATTRTRRLAERIADGHGPLNDEIIETIRKNGQALLDIPGPRVVQLIEEIDRLRAQLTAAKPGENYVAMSLGLASGERVNAWVDMETAMRVWHL